MRRHHFLSALVIFAAGFALSAVADGRRLASQGRGSLFNSVAAEVAAQTTQPPTLQKWEYRVVTKLVSNNQAGIDFELNRLGEQGYEMCGVVQSAGVPGTAILTITLRRPK